MENRNKKTKETLEKEHQDSSNWIFGIFYFNKNDDRIFPPKRIKQMGWTVNFANPISIFALLAIIVIITVVSRYFK